jgi:hypothetical protein
MGQVLDLNTLAFRKAEYKRQNLWILSMAGVDAWLARSASKPHLSFGDTMQVNYVATYSRYLSTRGSWNPIDITLNDAIDPSASLEITNLLLSQWDYETGRAGSKKQYAKEIQLKLLAPGIDASSTQTSVIEIWTINNAFFTDINFNASNLDYENTDRQTISFTLNYDNAVFSKA